MNSNKEMVQVALPKELLQQLFKGGQLKPKDLQCLNDESKQIVRTLCLESCKPESCSHCSLHQLCGQTVYSSVKQEIELVSFPKITNQ
ncbi:hypothetical protein J3998_03995 [Thiomicrorhabdus sp. 6S2-11]|jgi:hypothetical protein|uniref:Uncharacterized protein n=1 Tax=Thiomicrorhabdus marina TaxID=2818442 RepID=A0ABS3Q318_9GAMM|nr:hypothetical protein [Thiomicrorhabdus marina]MBO1926728.1 hypothetical protein [Thiomicrorhabdus marina]